MPRKIRELESALKKAGFSCKPGRGSHRKWRHSCGALVVMSGKSGDDAKRYQEKDVAQAIEQSQQP
jgi:predicted RNA binding protein YcfA (HicA-like mRNA interferase family)